MKVLVAAPPQSAESLRRRARLHGRLGHKSEGTECTQSRPRNRERAAAQTARGRGKRQANAARIRRSAQLRLVRPHSGLPATTARQCETGEDSGEELQSDCAIDAAESEGEAGTAIDRQEGSLRGDQSRGEGVQI